MLQAATVQLQACCDCPASTVVQCDNRQKQQVMAYLKPACNALLAVCANITVLLFLQQELLYVGCGTCTDDAAGQ